MKASDLENYSTFITLKGVFEEERIQTFIREMENKLAQERIGSRTSRKIFRIVVEILQNIYHHGLKGRDSSLQILENPKEFMIIGKNFIREEKVQQFRDHLNDVSKMDEEELVSEYQSTLSDGRFSEIGGAGLGILDIVRKSGQNMKYEFISVDPECSFFRIQVNVAR